MNNLSNKGQSLAIFIIFLPVFIMMGAFIVDLGLAKYNDNKIDNINKMVIKYGLNHIDENPYNDMVDLIYQNDSKIDSYSIDIDSVNKTIRISIDKSSIGPFGKIIDKQIYKEKSSYIGYIKDEKIIIERDDVK